METRKNPEKDLNKYSILFFQTGLLTALFLAVCAFEFETPVTSKPVVLPPVEEMPIYMMPLKTMKVPEPPKPRPRPLNPNPVESTTLEKAEEVVKIETPTLTPELNTITETIVMDLPPVEKVVEYAGYVEVMPEPEGGMDAFYKYLAKNLKYTSRAKAMDIEGKVFVQFLIDETGNITQVKVIRGLGAGLDEEAARVIAGSPPWNPGRQGGRKVRVRMVMPITFKLN